MTTIGSCLAVVIPRPIRNALKLSKGDLVALGLEEGRIIIRPLEPSELLRAPRYGTTR